jgi:phosphonate transport system substrate-binding protein
MNRFMAIFWAVFLSLPSPLVMANTPTPIRFAPLPLENTEATIKAFSGLLERMQAILEQPIELVYHEKYDEILSGLARGTIDIAFLGPLPYALLRNQGVPLEPLVLFRESNGEARYRCALIHFRGDDLSPRSLSKQRLAMTQRSSTCGYLGAAAILDALAGLKPEDLAATAYLGSHENVALAVVEGRADLGSLKEEFALKYKLLGLEILGLSPWLPGTGLFAHPQTVPASLRVRLREGLLQTPSNVYSGWGNAMRYGMAVAEEAPFEAFYALEQAFGPDHAKAAVPQ